MFNVKKDVLQSIYLLEEGYYQNKKGDNMFKKIILGALLFAGTSLLAMSVGELNKASKEELMEIKGVGEAKAEAIIKERNNAAFASVDDLEKVKGIGPAIVENVKNDVKSK